MNERIGKITHVAYRSFCFRKAVGPGMENKGSTRTTQHGRCIRRQGHDLEAHVQIRGLGQLSLVEHALCPLDPGRSLRQRLVHECEYQYTDSTGRRRAAQVRVTCPLGLSANDEFYLWGLLALTFSQPQPEVEFHATPHYCLRQLGVIDQHDRRGGRQYQQFSTALERLSAIRYQNQAFYDPVRAEHRRVSFGLFSYSLPLHAESSRAWRIVWDPLFFEQVSVIGGNLRFDMEVYRELDPATRRLFLLLSKVFRRRAKTLTFDLRHLGVQVLGFASTVATRDLKTKVSRCIKRLAELEIVSHAEPKQIFLRKTDRSVTVCLDRGRYFEQRWRNREMSGSVESPLIEPLRAIGVDAGVIPRLFDRYPATVIREWVDITLAAQERFGPGFFKRSPAAYFVHNVQHAGAGTRTPPDWWQELRRAERRVPRRQGKSQNGRSPAITAKTGDGAALPDAVTEAFRVQFEAAGQPAAVARRNAERLAKEYCQSHWMAETDPIERLLRLLA